MRPFWLEQALKTETCETCPALQGDIRAAVCIVGGGYTGLWTAIMLKEQNPGLEVVLIEADICGAGASGRNGGCALSWSAKYFTLERLFGVEEAVRLVKESERSIHAIGAFCERYGVDADYRLDGTLYTATNRAQVGSTDAVIAALERNGINSFTQRSLADVQRMAGSTRHLEGWFSPAAASVQPGKLVRGLRRVALQLGVRIHENTAMTGLEEGRPAVIQTANGSVRADRVVLAMNAWMARAFPQFERSVAIVSSDMLITEPRPDLLDEIGLTSGVTVLDSRIFVHYYHNTPTAGSCSARAATPSLTAGACHRCSISHRPMPVCFAQSDGLLPGVCRRQGRRNLERPVGSLGHRAAVLWADECQREPVLRFWIFRQRRRAVPHGRADSGFDGQGLDNPWTRSPLVNGPLGFFRRNRFATLAR
jgi:glycine/D-amino acid oxidase-like deaminating enzyme